MVDQRTNKVVAENFIFFGKPKKPIDKGYVKVFTAFLDSIVDNEEIAGKAIRLLLYMMKELDYNSCTVTVIPKYAVKELGIHRDTFYKWVRALEKHGIIQKVDTYTYKIKPYNFVKGDSGKIIELENGSEKRRRRRST
ncbi:MAG: helix-turn-helix domain-containing protein, partial [Nitrososphaerota archaeon]